MAQQHSHGEGYDDSRLREALAEAIECHTYVPDEGSGWFCSCGVVVANADIERHLADAIIAVLPEHRDDVLATAGMKDLAESREWWASARSEEISLDLAALRAENERLRLVENDALWLARLACSSSWPGEMAQQVENAASRVRSAFGPTKAQRHQEHYRTCGCLGDTSICCDPSCCPAEETTYEGC